MIEFGHGTHAGLRRKCNEDTYYADPSAGVFLVVDGMGGPGYGDRAAALARDTVVTALLEGAGLEAAVRRAADVLDSRHDAVSRTVPMGATLAALHVSPARFEAAWVGDCRIFIHTDSLRALVPASGDDPVDGPALPDPARIQAITQALGVTAREQLVIQRAEGTVCAPCCFLLCSDGLAEGVPLEAMARITARHDMAAQEVVDHLLLQALDQGGHDNATAIVLRCTRHAGSPATGGSQDQAPSGEW